MVLFTMCSTETKVAYNHNGAILPVFTNTLQTSFNAKKMLFSLFPSLFFSLLPHLESQVYNSFQFFVQSISYPEYKHHLTEVVPRDLHPFAQYES